MGTCLTDQDLTGAAAKVLEMVRDAAREALAADAASLELSSIKAVYGPDAAYDCPAIVLTPRKRDAARLVVEVHDEKLWRLTAGDGPGYEFYEGMEEPWDVRLAGMVRPVVPVSTNTAGSSAACG
jgi:allophanate hydrolase subunit 1